MKPSVTKVKKMIKGIREYRKEVDWSVTKKPNKDKEVTFDVDLSNDTHNKLVELAKSNKLSINDMCVKIIREILKEGKKIK